MALSSSFGNATNINKLDLTGCSNLDELPSSVRKPASLVSTDFDEDNNQPIVTVTDNSGSRCIEVWRGRRGKLYVLKGEELKEEHSLSLNLRLVDENGERFCSAPVKYPVTSSILYTF